MQISRFPSGGFVLNKVRSFSMNTYLSAWFDSKGNLLDHERKDGRKATRADIRKLEILGIVWARESV